MDENKNSLKAILMINRPELREILFVPRSYCKKKDEERTNKQKNVCKLFPFSLGHITLGQWSESMELVTNFKLPWRLLKEKLAKVNSNNEILYMTTLEMIESDEIVSNLVCV